MRNSRALSLLGATLTAACAGDGHVATTAFVEERTTRGDTLVVANVTGQQWAADGHLEEVLRIGRTDGTDEYTFGRIIAIAARGDGPVSVYDDKFQRLRMYGTDGSFIRNVGRTGSGPGEYQYIIGLGTLAGGSVAGWDAGNHRVNVFTAQGERAAEFVIPLGSSQFMPKPFGVDTASTFYILNAFGGRLRMLHTNRRGVVTDTLQYPRGQPFVGTDGVHARLEVALHPNGYFVWGVGDRYIVHAQTPAGQPLRIERRMEPPSFASAERARLQARLDSAAGGIPPAQRQRGEYSVVPNERPMFVDIQVGLDGTIWILRGPPPSEYDVFSPDGTYLGRVPVPADVSLHVIDGAHIWGIARDEDGVQFVVRYHLQTS